MAAVRVPGGLHLATLPPDRLIWVGVGASAALSGLGWLITPEAPWASRGVQLLMTGCVAVLLLCWWRLGPQFRHPLPVAVAWAAPLLLAPPLFSQDVAAYLAQGRMVTSGLDPYTTPLATTELPGLPVGHHWATTTSVYPPGSLWLFAAAHWLGLGHPGAGVLWLRIITLLALWALAEALRRIAGHLGIPATSTLWLGAACPLFLVQGVGGVHNDAVLAALIAWAVVAALRGGWSGLLLGGAIVGVAMLVKQSGAAAGPGVVALALAPSIPRSWPMIVLRAAAAGAVAGAVFVTVSLASGFGFGWANATAGSPLAAMNSSPWSWVAQVSSWLAPGGTALPVISALAWVAVLVAWGWLIRRWGPRPGDPGQPWPLLFGCLLAFVVAGPATQPWYLLWVVPFLICCIRPLRIPQQGAVIAVVALTLLGPLQGALDVLPGLAVTLAVAWWLNRRTTV
ncbi:MAG: polyprenol phosphomannose-dependent alpha 1,6 mannosyltransferase MptB [Arachnia propionica]|uniref:polyprenol phosphomannose-dependent alpha 1,6 mannosyltransferase MptB n=1 Tax=Arachnia propionica TaxID=1750 RepID=UPI00270013D3|nr:polyprenol phosphomannose-dependent alpha 1,6 mannosyltransferase MptB [Arachnia propionica]